ncbi:hypothetical protein Hanom_Chr16g01478791 [Helianthus anomalus]
MVGDLCLYHRPSSSVTSHPLQISFFQTLSFFPPNMSLLPPKFSATHIDLFLTATFTTFFNTHPFLLSPGTLTNRRQPLPHTKTLITNRRQPFPHLTCKNPNYLTGENPNHLTCGYKP